MVLIEILEKAREVAATTVREDAERVDREAAWPGRGIRRLQAAGLGGLVAPPECGGLGQGLLAVTQVCEIIGQECGSTALSYAMHCVGTAVIAAKATPHQKKNFLEPISAGAHLTTLSLSEPGSGSHFYFPETTLSKGLDGELLIAGKKSFVTNGSHADSYVVSTAAADPLAPPGQFSMVVVPEATPGMHWSGQWNGLGMRGNSSLNLLLERVRLPKENLLGEEGDQIWYVFEVVTPFFLMGMAGSYLGIAQAALNETIAHLKGRSYSHSGSNLAGVGILQHRLGTLWSRLEGARRLVYFAAAEGEKGGKRALISMLSAKAEVADCVTSVVGEAMNLVGGRAYAENSRMARYLRDSRAIGVMAPTTDILRTWTGRALLDLPLLGD